MHLIEILLFSPLLVASIWLGYLNYRILKVTEEVLKVTHNLDKVTMHVDALTQQVVANTSIPDDMITLTATSHHASGTT
ncbi:hypothetical protein CL634_03605 [bacterium]|nr:hypothetical protein [bacterium]